MSTKGEEKRTDANDAEYVEKYKFRGHFRKTNCCNRNFWFGFCNPLIREIDANKGQLKEEMVDSMDLIENET